MTKQELRGFCAKFSASDRKKLPKMEGLFNHMWEDYDKYIRLADGDFPFWSTEWNLVGHLAVAASKLGPVAMEYSEKKPRGTKTRRPDAWFRMSDKKGESGQELIIEAKRVELSLDREREFILRKVKENMGDCQRQLRGQEDSSWISPIIFLQPFLAIARVNRDKYQRRAEEFIANCQLVAHDLANKGNRIFFGHYFLEWDELSKATDEKYYYPGVGIIGDLQAVK